jgi:hypothetical protein
MKRLTKKEDDKVGSSTGDARWCDGVSSNVSLGWKKRIYRSVAMEEWTTSSATQRSCAFERRESDDVIP